MTHDRLKGRSAPKSAVRNQRGETFRCNGTASAVSASARFTSATIVMLAGTLGITQTTSPSTKAQIKTDPKINEPFMKPDLKAYIKRFESNDREPYAKRHEIVAALGLVRGMSVADVGAGTGFFTRLFSEKVGETGKVYAVDIAPSFWPTSPPNQKNVGRPMS